MTITADLSRAVAVDLDAEVCCGYGGPGWTEGAGVTAAPACSAAASGVARLECEACGYVRRVPLCLRHLLKLYWAEAADALTHGEPAPQGHGRMVLDDFEGRGLE